MKSNKKMSRAPTEESVILSYIDKNTNTSFTHEIISSRVLKNHGCSGVIEVEYFCKNCGLKEVHSVNSSGCGL